MGCVPGEIVEMDNIESFGDPLSIRVAGYQLSLRKDEAASILIDKI